MRAPTRTRSYACIHPETFRYTFDSADVAELWRRLKARWGAIRHNPAFRTIEIETPRFFLRAIDTGNPITVVRKRSCTEADVEDLHALFGFTPGPEACDRPEADS